MDGPTTFDERDERTLNQLRVFSENATSSLYLHYGSTHIVFDVFVNNKIKIIFFYLKKRANTLLLKFCENSSKFPNYVCKAKKILTIFQCKREFSKQKIIKQETANVVSYFVSGNSDCFFLFLFSDTQNVDVYTQQMIYIVARAKNDLKQNSKLFADK